MSSTKRTPAHSAYNLPEAAAAEVAAAAAEATAAAADAPVPGSEAAAAEEDAPVPAVAEAVPTVVAEGATAVEAAAVAAASGSGGAAAAAAAAAEAGAVGYGLNLAGFGLANQSASESKNLADRIAEYQPEAIVSLLLGIKDFVDAAAIAAGSSAAAGRYHCDQPADLCVQAFEPDQRHRLRRVLVLASCDGSLHSIAGLNLA
jgi:hypothetical protein